MFKWKRRGSRLQEKQSERQPSVAEDDKGVPYDLWGAQLRILGNSALTIIDAGAHLEYTTDQYLKNFPRARVLAIAATVEEFVEARAWEPVFGDRLTLVRAILSDTAGVTELRRNAGDATHSPFESGESPSPDESPTTLAPQKIETVTVDDICASRGIEFVDVLKMNTQASELQALKGAEAMLSRGAIRLVVLNVKFVAVEGKLPTFWYIAEHLRRYGYNLQGIYEWQHQPRLPAILREAEAVFVAPQMQVLPGAPLSPLLLDEISEATEGYRLPDKFLDAVYLLDGAAVRVQAPVAGHTTVSDQPIEAPAGLASILNVIIDTSPEAYRYSLMLNVDNRITHQLRGNGFITVELSLKVIAGRIGIVWTDENYQPLVTTERYVSAMPGVQSVLVSVPAKQAHRLVFRNVAGNSTKATFRITRIKAKIVGESPYQRASNEPDAEALFRRAQVMARAGDLKTAARLFVDIAAQTPNHAEALEGQGEVLDMMGQSDLATTKYDAARALQAEGRNGTPDRTFALRRRGRSTAEIAAYTSALHLAKDRAFAYIARGNAFLAEGRAERALADYEVALQLKPGAHEIISLKGEALSMLGCYLEALEAFDLAVAARPQDAETLSGRAIVHLALNNLKAADADWCRQLERLPPAQASARACVALRLADYEAALPDLERALEKDSTDPYWQLYRLTALRRLGRPAKPAVATEAAAKAWPSLLLALHASSVAGEQVLSQADNDGRRAEALFQLGVLAFPQDRKEARRLWTEVLRQSRPDLIEHAAARHELARLGS
jgi:FkbM family methyltransferase